MQERERKKERCYKPTIWSKQPKGGKEKNGNEWQVLPERTSRAGIVPSAANVWVVTQTGQRGGAIAPIGKSREHEPGQAI